MPHSFAIQIKWLHFKMQLFFVLILVALLRTVCSLLIETNNSYNDHIVFALYSVYNKHSKLLKNPNQQKVIITDTLSLYLNQCEFIIWHKTSLEQNFDFSSLLSRNYYYKRVVCVDFGL